MTRDLYEETDSPGGPPMDIPCGPNDQPIPCVHADNAEIMLANGNGIIAFRTGDCGVYIRKDANGLREWAAQLIRAANQLGGTH